jgi:hypothetical protein
VEEANQLARRISRLHPQGLSDLQVRYNALGWLMLEADDVIVDRAARRAFIAFGRALRQLSRA